MLNVRRRREAPRLDRLEEFRVRTARKRFGHPHTVAEHSKRPPGGDFRVLEQNAPRRRVPGIGVKFRPQFFLALVEEAQTAVRHVNLAADLNLFRDGKTRVGFRELERHVRDGPHIMRHVVSLLAVAPRDSLDQNAFLVVQRHGDAIDLQFQDPRDHGPGREFLVRVIGELPHALRLVNVFDRQHDDFVPDLFQRIDDVSADPLRRATLARKLRVAGLEEFQPLHHEVELAVRNLGDRIIVVTLI